MKCPKCGEPMKVVEQLNAGTKVRCSAGHTWIRWPKIVEGDWVEGYVYESQL